MEDMVIVGAGECGTRAAFALRESGHPGPITLIGDESHMPYERPPLSKPSDGGARMKAICTKDMLDAAGITYLQGQTAIALDTTNKVVRFEGGASQSFHKLLLATGARPRLLTCPGAELASVLRTYDHASAIFSQDLRDRSVVIIGAGLIGMELAAVARLQGAIVHVIEAAPAILGRAVPARFAKALHQRHHEEGVIFHLGTGVIAIEPGGVNLSGGTLIAADSVVAAVGVVPNIQLAEEADLAVGNGILTNRQLTTSHSDIFAAGDCAAVEQPGGGHFRFETWRSARSQAELAARNILGAAEDFTASPSFWSDQYDLGLQVVGWHAPDCLAVERATPSGVMEFYLRDSRLVGAAGLGDGNAIAKDVKLAEMLIQTGNAVDPVILADPGFTLKAVLRRSAA